MKKILKIVGIIFLLLIIGAAWYAYTPVDIRPDYADGNLSAEDKAKGKMLIKDMEAAYGGKAN